MTIRTKILLLGIVPLLMIGPAFYSSLVYLETSSIKQILDDKHSTYNRSWNNLVNQYGEFLAFSSSLIRQNKHLIRSLKTNDPKQIGKHTDNVWNQLSDSLPDTFLYGR